MKVFIISVDHRDQIAPIRNELEIGEIMAAKDKVRALVKEMITSQGVDLICEESDPSKLSIAQQEAFNHRPRIPWKNINMTSQQRLEAGIFEPLLYRPSGNFTSKGEPFQLEHRVPEDNVRENFFRYEILKAANRIGAKSVLVLCGDMHTEALKKKLKQSGREVITDGRLAPEKRWK